MTDSLGHEHEATNASDGSSLVKSVANSSTLERMTRQLHVSGMVLASTAVLLAACGSNSTPPPVKHSTIADAVDTGVAVVATYDVMELFDKSLADDSPM